MFKRENEIGGERVGGARKIGKESWGVLSLVESQHRMAYILIN